MIRISLNLSTHCIQKEIKRLYNRRLSDCLKSSVVDPETEEEIELLVYALENFDFPGLRAQYAVLAGGEASTVALVKDDEGRVVIVAAGRVIDPWQRSG